MGSRRTRFQALGVALALYGIVGIIIFVVVAAAVARPLDRAQQLTASVDETRSALVDSLTQAETTIRGMSTSVDNIDTSLGDAKTAIDRASTISHSLATSMYGLRDAMSISILGAQPLIGLSSGFDTSGQNLDQLGDDVAAIGTALEQNRSDTATTSQNLTALADSVGDLTQSVSDGPAVGIKPGTLNSIKLAVYAVTGWLIVFAVGCLIAGIYMIRWARRQRPDDTPSYPSYATT